MLSLEILSFIIVSITSLCMCISSSVEQVAQTDESVV